MDIFDKKRNALLFDLDGTLINTALGFEALLNDLNWPIKKFDSLAHYYSGLSIKKFLQHLLVDRGSIEKDIKEFSQSYSDNIEKYTFFYPHVEKILNELSSKKIIWGIISNKQHAQCVKICQKFNLKPDFLLGSGLIPFKKPHPAPLLKGANKLGLQPQNCYYFGDMPTDIEAGEKAMMKSVYCRYGCHQYLEPDFTYKRECNEFSDLFERCQIKKIC